MSWLFSRALVEAYLVAHSSGGEPCVQWSSTATAPGFSWPGKTTSPFPPFRSGTTCSHLTGDHGALLLTWCLAGSLVRRSARQQEVGTGTSRSGPRPCESSERSSPAMSLSRTSNGGPLPRRGLILFGSGFLREWEFARRPLWVRRIVDYDGGWLPTPTAKANHDAPSMTKWPAYASYQRWLGGRRTSPRLWEWMMGWPIGWTALEPLETGRCRQWFGLHGSC